MMNSARQLLATAGGLLLCAVGATSVAAVTYTYDSLNRLTRAMYENGTVVLYEYDAVGNRTARITNSDPATVYLNVGVDPPGRATVRREPDLAWYPLGTEVILTAESTACQFDRWSGDVPPGHERDNPLTIQLDDYTTITLHMSCPPCNPCDMNCDGDVNALDIEPFLDLLFNGATPCDTCTGDVNDDGSIDALDIEPFLNCLFP